MANTSVESTREVAGEVETPQVTVIARQDAEQPLKLKGRARLAASLQRISSSQSLAKIGRARARTYSGTGKGSISCISLNSTNSNYATSFGTPLTSESSNGPCTAPTSTVNTPGAHSWDEHARIRTISNLDEKSSAAVPSGLTVMARPNTATPGITEVDEDYFSRTIANKIEKQPRRKLNFFDMPSEMKVKIFTYLEPREIVRSSRVSKDWHRMCYDGQLWSVLDTSTFYQEIPADALVTIITKAGPFVRDLNLRGCVQLRERWHIRGLSDACRNLQNFSLEGCRIDRTAIHSFLYANNRLVHLNLSGLAGATNSAMRIIAANCPKLEHLNISWCNNVNTHGLQKVVEACPNLKDVRAGEVSGWEDVDFMQQLFLRNNLERLVLMHCDSLTDESLAVLIEGKDSEIDFLTGRPIAPPRKLKHLDLTRCRGISDRGVRTFVNNIPEIEGLQLSKCNGIVDETITQLIPTTPMLTHLDLEELEALTNAVPQSLANSPCAKRLRHLSVSYCENIGDIGMLPLIQSCTGLQSLEMDNTRISNLVLVEAAAMVRQRTPRTIMTDNTSFQPTTGLRLIAYDCSNVTWTGVREILSRNAEVITTTKHAELPPLEKNTTEVSPSPTGISSSSPSSSAEQILPPTRSASPRIHVVREHAYPSQIIHLKCFYTYLPTVEEHTKRVLRGDFAAARRLERKWAEFMIAQEEMGADGVGSRRRRRRAREAEMMHADEANMAVGMGVGGGRRRRARSGGCAVM
jgi:F-box/leucine-rich repeat protein 2/20